MSAKRSALLRLAMAAGTFGCCAIAMASEEALPDVEFLEYLGSWEESDEDWLVAESIGAVRQEGELLRSDPAADAEELPEQDPEKDDES